MQYANFFSILTDVCFIVGYCTTARWKDSNDLHLHACTTVVVFAALD